MITWFSHFLAFLKNPQENPHPIISLDDVVHLDNRAHSAGMAQEHRQTAIVVMESGIFRHGKLRGTNRTPDPDICEPEKMVLKLAAVLDIAKTQDCLWDFEPINDTIRTSLIHVTGAPDNLIATRTHELIIHCLKPRVKEMLDVSAIKKKSTQ